MPADDPRLVAAVEAVLHRELGYMPRPWPKPLELAVRAAREGLAARLARRDEATTDALISAATISHTSLLRHRGQLERLGEELERLGRPARIWCAGCSTGEEPYSVALIAEARGASVQVLATDVDPASLATARAGVYDARVARRAGLEVSGARWEVPASLRAMVRFERASLTGSDPTCGEGPFDVVFCRNVMIYFDAEVSRRILSRLASSTQRDGALVLAPVEALRPIPEGLRRGEPLGWLERRRAELPPAARTPAPPPPPREDDLLQATRAIVLEDYEGAERALYEILTDTPDRAEGWYLLGDLLDRRGEGTQARAAFARAAELARADPEGESIANAAQRRAQRP